MIRSLLTLSPLVVVVALTTWGVNPEMWYRATPLALESNGSIWFLQLGFE
jgi:hypothetical protein